MKMVILGGGFIGQLLQAVVWPKARVLDWASLPPSTPPRLLGPQYLWHNVPELICRKFNVYTRIDNKDATPTSMRAYKVKVEKEQDNSDWRAQFAPVMDGYECLLPQNRVEYNRRAVSINYGSRRIAMADGASIPYDVLISTIALPTLLTLAGVRTVDFKSRAIYLHRQNYPPVENGNMLVNYVSYANTDIYRVTYRGSEQHTESLSPFSEFHAREVTKITPGKIYQHEKAGEIIDAMRAVNIYPFGRFASWAPDELAHESLHAARQLQSDLCLT